MTKHWAEDFYSDLDISPHADDERVFLSFLMLPKIHGEPPSIRARHQVEDFVREHHAGGAAASKGSWVRFELWLEKQRELTGIGN